MKSPTAKLTIWVGLLLSQIFATPVMAAPVETYVFEALIQDVATRGNGIPNLPYPTVIGTSIQGLLSIDYDDVGYAGSNTFQWFYDNQPLSFISAKIGGIPATLSENSTLTRISILDNSPVHDGHDLISIARRVNDDSRLPNIILDFSISAQDRDGTSTSSLALPTLSALTSFMPLTFAVWAHVGGSDGVEVSGQIFAISAVPVPVPLPSAALTFIGGLAGVSLLAARNRLARNWRMTARTWPRLR